MKLKISAFDGNADHRLIVNTPLSDVTSLVESDAILIDPDNMALELRSIPTGHGAKIQAFVEGMTRKQSEIRAFLERKRGVVICYLRQSSTIWVPNSGQTYNNYSLLQGVRMQNGDALHNPIISRIRAGVGEQYQPVGNDPAATGFFRILRGKVKIEAYFDVPPEENAGEVLAINPVRYPVALSVNTYDKGRVYFLPVPSDAEPSRIGAAVVELVRTYYGGALETIEPEWAASVVVPGSNQWDSEIESIQSKILECEKRLEELEHKRTHLLSFKRLLFGTGTEVLEPAVREALRLFDFQVLGPEDYEEEWDARIEDRP
jgi:hypothetical protein